VPSKSLALDAMRGIAALLVCVGHIRACVFVDWADVAAQDPIKGLLYIGTGLGTQAVMIFFVLSGYLVGGNVLASVSADRWSWRTYAAKRLTRLWIVLVPALFLTLLCDRIGAVLLPHAYDGKFYALLLSGPESGKPMAEGLGAFVGNLLFLQTIVTPVYGSNSPLWSLANEFWYYLLFPLLVLAPRSSGPMKVLLLSLAVAIIVWLPLRIVLLGIVWLMGAAAWWFARQQKVPLLVQRTPLVILAGLATLLVTLYASRSDAWYGSHYAIGAATAFVVYGIAAQPAAHGRSIGRAIERFLAPPVRFLSDISYTLYLVHFPFVILMWFGVLAPAQYQPNLAGFTAFAALLAATLIYAYLVWWCFERHTPLLQARTIAALEGWDKRSGRQDS
jgi:peptidoglycan/LPS O-acetylase OafA/YrhL